MRFDYVLRCPWMLILLLFFNVEPWRQEAGHQGVGDPQPPCQGRPGADAGERNDVRRHSGVRQGELVLLCASVMY